MKRANYRKIKGAIRRLRPTTGRAYLDRRDRVAFMFSRDRLTRAWIITQVSADDLAALMSELNTGEQIATLPITRYVIGLGIVRRNTSPDLMTHGEDGELPKQVEMEQPRITRKDVAFEMRMGHLEVPDSEALLLAERIGRAVVSA